MVDRVDAVAVLLNNEMSRLTSMLRRNGEDNISTREWMRRPTLNERVSRIENVMNCDLASLKERVSMVEEFIIGEKHDAKYNALNEKLDKQNSLMEERMTRDYKVIMERVEEETTAITMRLEKECEDVKIFAKSWIDDLVNKSNSKAMYTDKDMQMIRHSLDEMQSDVRIQMAVMTEEISLAEEFTEHNLSKTLI